MKYYGLHRGYVVKSDDSAEDHGYLGRVKVAIPEVYGEVDDIESLPWAWPCISAYSGGIYDIEKEESDVNAKEGNTTIASGLIAIPPVGSTVWIMFMQGDPQVPVYMGTWIGKGSAMPSAAQGDNYPKIFLLKMPWGKDMYLRADKDKVFELRFDDMHIQLKAESSEGKGDAEMFLWTENANIRIATTEGDVALQGKNIGIYSENDMTIRAGQFQKDPETDEVTVLTEGSLLVEATKDTTIHAQEKGIVKAPDGGEWQMRAPKASGFDKHGDFEEMLP